MSTGSLRRKPYLIPLNPKMEFIDEFKFNWAGRFLYNGDSGYMKATTIISMIYDESYGNDNLYYMRFNSEAFPDGSFYHMMEGNQDEIQMYQIALWARETPKDYYNYITSSTKSKGVVNQVIFLDRTLASAFSAKINEIITVVKEAKERHTLPISKKDVITTVISSVISEVADLDVFSGIVLSLMITGLSNVNNVIDNPDGSFVMQIIKLLKTKTGNAEILEDDKTGTTFTSSNIGLEIILRTKILLPNSIYEETDSVEIWDKGSLGKDYIKLVQPPKFYKGHFLIDSKVFENGTTNISIEKIAEFFGWTEYLDLAKAMG